MPAKRLDSEFIEIGQYDVAGQDSDEVPNLVRHVALCAQTFANLTDTGCALRLTHMLPPFSVGDETHEVQTAGWAVLSVDELLQMQLFVDELDSEYQAQVRRGAIEYTICPHYLEPSEHFPFRRFNCAGFVVEAYRFAGIELLAIDDNFPKVTLTSLKHAYPDQARRLDNPVLRRFMGLEGMDGPWPVVLAGYVINSLNRSAEEIRESPYSPVEADAYFPPIKS